MRRVEITDHALDRWRERVGSKKSKNQLAHMVYGSILSQSRLGINIENEGLKFKLRIPTHNIEAVIKLEGKPARWKAITFEIPDDLKG